MFELKLNKVFSAYIVVSVWVYCTCSIRH